MNKIMKNRKIYIKINFYSGTNMQNEHKLKKTFYPYVLMLIHNGSNTLKFTTIAS